MRVGLNGAISPGSPPSFNPRLEGGKLGGDNRLDTTHLVDVVEQTLCLALTML